MVRLAEDALYLIFHPVLPEGTQISWLLDPSDFRANADNAFQAVLVLDRQSTEPADSRKCQDTFTKWAVKIWIQLPAHIWPGTTLCNYLLHGRLAMSIHAFIRLLLLAIRRQSASTSPIGCHSEAAPELSIFQFEARHCDNVAYSVVVE